jgi:hypothetical protein
MAQDRESGKEERIRFLLPNVRKKIADTLYDFDQVKEIDRLAREAPPEYSTDDVTRVAYAALTRLGPLSTEEVTATYICVQAYRVLKKMLDEGEIVQRGDKIETI